LIDYLGQSKPRDMGIAQIAVAVVSHRFLRKAGPCFSARSDHGAAAPPTRPGRVEVEAAVRTVERCLLGRLRRRPHPGGSRKERDPAHASGAPADLLKADQGQT
jgi:hypothetical protein